MNVKGVSHEEQDDWRAMPMTKAVGWEMKQEILTQTESIVNGLEEINDPNQAFRLVEHARGMSRMYNFFMEIAGQND